MLVGSLITTASLLLFAATALLHDPDGELFQRFQQGDQQAFATLMRKHERGVVSFIYRKTGDIERARELGQEVFLRVIARRDSWSPSAKFSTWLFTIARNLCIDESRRARHRQSSSLDEDAYQDSDGSESKAALVADDRAESPDSAPVRAEFRRRIQSLADQLPDEQREVFHLRHIQDLRFTEIAEIQGVSENTVKSRMRYALQFLRDQLRDYDGFSFDAREDDEMRRSSPAHQKI